MSGDMQIDVRGLDPPEPMERVLDALSRLAHGSVLVMLIDREPRPLFRILDNNDFDWECKPSADFCFEVRIWHKN